MPVEIKELHIRVAVDAKPGHQTPDAKTASGEADKDSIVAACVEQVLQIIQSKKER